MVAQGPKEVPEMIEPNNSLNLTVGKQAAKKDEDPRKPLLVVKLQVKTSLVDAIVDSGSQKNLISETLVQKPYEEQLSRVCLTTFSKLQEGDLDRFKASTAHPYKSLRRSRKDFVIVCLDDILVYSRTWEGHLAHIEKVFEVLQNGQLKLNRKKYKFGKDE
ncbi:uncharacterized protein LOC109841519 [Asparagus officinalis]|uniref:uncharacterized protein LOC109841519 n=1 Tax=Asparagus officinalis TaxID=4686 RepID=UPI00098E8043|nr:uncharacterized protein LOC109841519 [Asparagus officinalis]